jgi:nucleoside-diphosphate-sugar epimerase
MQLLVIGGSGRVGRMVLPHLARQHRIRVLDLVTPSPGPWEHVIGSVDDLETVASSLTGVDALVYMAMNTQDDWGSVSTVSGAFDVNIKGLYLSLWAASDQGVRHVVYTSSLSVYRERDGLYPDDSQAPDAIDFYGLTKRLGEEVCRARVIESDVTVTALRLCFPTADDAPVPTEPRFRATTFTRAYDVAQAILAALNYRHGFEAITISGDADGRVTSLRKAKQLLDWQPTRPVRAP